MDIDRDSLETREHTGTTRRWLLSAATRGFALAASGLFLPEWPEEAAAREGALDGDKGGRHGKDHRGRGKRKRRDHGDQKDKGQRDHGDQKDKDKGRDEAPPPQGHGPFRATALTVVNRITRPLDCTFYYRVKGEGDSYGPPLSSAGRTLGPNEEFRYDPDRFRVGVLVKQAYGSADVYADVRNVPFWYPRGGVTQGLNLDPHAGKVGFVLIREQEYAENEAHDQRGIILKRRLDTENRVEWKLDVYPD